MLCLHRLSSGDAQSTPCACESQDIAKHEPAEGRLRASIDVSFNMTPLASKLIPCHTSLSSKLQTDRLCSKFEFAGCVPDSKTKRTMPTLHMSAAAPS